jgi:hypothetical protein
MRLAAVFMLVAVLFLQAAVAEGALPETIKEAADAADGVVVGLAIGHGEGGSFPYIEVRVLEVLKGKDPGRTLAAAFPQEAISGISMRAVQAAHGTVYIIPYSTRKDEKGRYIYMGPRFDSREVIASPENISAVNPDSVLFQVPTFEEALRESDIVAVGTIDYENFEENEAGKKTVSIESDKLYFNILEVIEGGLPEKRVRLALGGNYYYWLFYGGGFTVKGAALVSQDPKLLLIRKKGEVYHYAGPGFTSGYFLATPENISLTRRLLRERTQEAAPQDEPASATNPEHDWTWWIVGAAAAVVALVAALLVSNVDYKYDRRRERFEIHDGSPHSDSDPGSSESKP